MRRVKNLLLALCIFGVVFSASSVRAFDASEVKSMMTISPPREKIILVPGETYSGSVDVANAANATQDLKYSVRVGSFSLRKDEKGETDYNNTDVDTITSYNQIMNWITLGKEDGIVSPNGVDTIPYIINVPKDAPAGGQYASIIIRNDTNSDDVGNGNISIQNVVEFAVGIFADVAGETRNEGKIVDNNIPAFLLSSPLVASSVVRNDGNVHTNASYVLQVWPLFSNEEICTNEEDPEISMIMPETERYHAQSCDLPMVGVFRVRQEVKIFGETSVVERTIIICPLWLLFLILFAIIMLIFWIFMKTKDRKNKKREFGDS